MEVIRVDRKKHKEIQELFVQEPRLFSPKWKPGQLVTSASRVYKFLEKAGAEPELLHDFVKVCELAEIPYVYIVTGQEEVRFTIEQRVAELEIKMKICMEALKALGLENLEELVEKAFQERYGKRP